MKEHSKYNYSNQNYCICGKLITNYAKSCGKCNGIIHSKIIIGYKLSEETKTKMSENRKGINNGNFKHGETLKKHYCIDCGKEISYPTWKYGSRLCMICSRKGKRNYFFGKLPLHGKRRWYNNICFRSSWEILFAQFLDLSGIKYKYESKTFDLGNTTYTPDFYLPEFDLYIEIKGWWRDNAKKKFKIFKKNYSDKNIKIFMKKELQEMGII